MFEFTNWILEEGRAGKALASSDGKSPSSNPLKQAERPQTLVQTVVRPPSSEAFQVEDALKAGTRVSSACSTLVHCTHLNTLPWVVVGLSTHTFSSSGSFALLTSFPAFVG